MRSGRQRWEQLGGKQARLDGDGRKFEEIAQQRRREALQVRGGLPFPMEIANNQITVDSAGSRIWDREGKHGFPKAKEDKIYDQNIWQFLKKHGVLK